MSEIYAFCFSLGLGIAARLLFLGVSALAKRTNLMPVTVVLDLLFTATIGGAFTLYTVLTATVLAPFMFAALFSGYIITYCLTKSKI